MQESQTKRSRPAWWLWVAAVAVIAGVLWYYGQPATGPFAGERAPNFEVTTLDQDRIAFESLLDKPVLINFWATWCLPCLEEMPAIQALYEKYPGAFHVMAISDEPLDTVTRYLEDFDYTFPIYLDPRGEVGRTYLVQAMPTSLFIDQRGIIRTRHIGQMTAEQMEQYLQPLL